MKTARPKFSELKIQAVFTWKNEGLSRFYDQKFPQSYATSRDGIARPDKCRRQSNCPYWRMLAKSWTGKYFPDARAHLVVRLANSAFEMTDEFTRNSFPFQQSVAFSPFVETLVASSERNAISIGEIWRESIYKRSHLNASPPAIFSRLRAFVILNLLSKRLKFRVKFTVKTDVKFS